MPDEPPTKLCLNPDCTGKNPVIGNWCTARECKDMRKLAVAAKKADKQVKACAAVGVPVPADCDWRVGYARIIWDILGYSGIYGALCFFGRIRLRRKEGVTQIP